MTPIRADLHGSTLATTGDLSACSFSPVIELCRMIVEEGHDPSTPMEVYRGDTLCLQIRSIGEAAGLEVTT
jgi:hypothetical protein